MAIDDPVPDWGILDTIRGLSDRPSTFLQIAGAVAPKNLYLGGNTVFSLQDKLQNLARVISASEAEGIARQQAQRFGNISQQFNTPMSAENVFGAQGNGGTGTPGTPGTMGTSTPPSIDPAQFYAQLVKDPGFIMELGGKAGGAGLLQGSHTMLQAAGQRYKDIGAARANYQALVQTAGMDPRQAQQQALSLAQAGVHVPADIAFTPKEISDAAREVALTKGPMARANLEIEQAKAFTAKDQVEALKQERGLQDLVASGGLDPNNFANVRQMVQTQFPRANVARALYANSPMRMMAYATSEKSAELDKSLPPGYMAVVDGVTTDQNGIGHVQTKIVPQSMSDEDTKRYILSTQKSYADMMKVGMLDPEIGRWVHGRLNDIQFLPPADRPKSIMELNNGILALMGIRERAQATASQKDIYRVSSIIQELRSSADKIDKDQNLFFQSRPQDMSKWKDTDLAVFKRYQDRSDALRSAALRISVTGWDNVPKANQIAMQAIAQGNPSNVSPVGMAVPKTINGLTREMFLQNAKNNPAIRNLPAAQQEVALKALAAQFDQQASSGTSGR